MWSTNHRWADKHDQPIGTAQLIRTMIQQFALPTSPVSAVGNVIDQPQVSRHTWSANRDSLCNVHALSVARKCDEPTTRENANWSANKNSLWITRVYLSAYIYFFFHTSIYFKPTNATIFYLLIVMNCSSRLLEFKSLGIFSISFSLLKYGIFSIFGFLTV